jgi:hypothetical protein
VKCRSAINAIAAFYRAADDYSGHVSTSKPLDISVPRPGRRCLAPSHTAGRPQAGIEQETLTMTQQRTSRIIGRGAIFAGALAASAFIASGAFAGECPADKIKPNVREPVNLSAVGVTDTKLVRSISAKSRQDQGPRVALPQADDRSGRYRAMA